MKCRIRFKINFDLLQNSKGNKWKMEGKIKKKETKEYENQI
jgi:hypothetical protein